MPEEHKAIRAAAEVAHQLADGLAQLVRSSQVPASHWDEVVERLRELLAIADDPPSQEQ